MNSALAALVNAELAQPVDPRVAALAAHVAARHPGALAVLFYGSCLWKAGQGLDGQMLDFYLIVRDYREAFGRGWLALANRLLPPNVFPIEAGGLAAKYAVLSLADLHRECGPDARDASTFARFAQPLRLVWVAADGARDVASAVARAAPSLFELAMPMLPSDEGVSVADIWRRAFALTYDAELRAERSGRSNTLVASDPARYEAVGQAVLAEIALRRGVGPNGEAANALSPEAAARRWRDLARRGKRRQVLKLAKASLTYAGGIDYLAWKINRHAGTHIEVRPWQRRWPLLGAITLLPKLLRGGAVK